MKEVRSISSDHSDIFNVTIDITIKVWYFNKCNQDGYNKSVEENEMSNFSKISVPDEARVELHDQIGLTGAEVSINNLPAGACVPFIHSHKKNEEIYVILSGKGKAVVDGETISLAAGDWIRISPEGKRQFFAADDSAISFACIQVKADSLEEYTGDDAVM